MILERIVKDILSNEDKVLLWNFNLRRQAVSGEGGRR